MGGNIEKRADATTSKEYQIPELVDLNNAGEAQAYCLPGSGNMASGCSVGSMAATG